MIMFKLYIRSTCPFCIKVLEFINENNVEFEKKDIADADNNAELLELGGKSQVPFLVDEENGVSMYESADIIEYIQKNYIKN